MSVIEWDGERCVPLADDMQVVYEHLHRYHLAAHFADGKEVLDLGSGEGYGSAILAVRAARVAGIEVDSASVAHSRATYSVPNLSFVQGSILALDGMADGSADLIVCFEVIEHIVEHEALIATCRRLLRPQGLLFLSTPDRRLYSEATGYVNPFHRRELERDELLALLGQCFPHVALWGQSPAVGSELELLSGSGERAASISVRVSRQGGDWSVQEAQEHVYMVAVASAVPLPPLPERSWLSDVDLTLVRALEGRSADAEQALERERAVRGELVTAQEELGAIRGREQALRDALSVAGRRSEELERDHRTAIRLEEEIARLQEAVRGDARLEDRLRVRDGEIAGLRAELGEVERRRTAWEEAFRLAVGSKGWRALELLRQGRDRVAGRRRDNSRVAALLASGARVSPRNERPTATSLRHSDPRGKIALTPAESPTVSIVIPVYDQAELTYRCLESVAGATPHDLIEVIVVDDCSGPDTREMLDSVAGISVLRNAGNLGFLQSASRGIAAAQGEHVVLLNNDTEVREGWLEALLDAVASDPSVAAVGSKLVYPDGRLQEAGGVIWNDATGWNVGKGHDSEAPEFNYRREVDYCSAASLLVRRSAFAEVGGFDERFAPGYYEDADLCFALREAGWRVLYEPRSVVVHHEGATHGTDARGGAGTYTKSSQRANRHIFAAKWTQTLASHRPPNTADGQLGGRVDRRPRVLVVDSWVPAWDKDAGSLRMNWILRLLIECGCHVTLFPFNRALVQPYTSDLQRAGIEVNYGEMPFEELVRRRSGLYDLVLLSRPEVALAHIEHVRRHQPRALLAYDTVDLHFVREARRLKLFGEEAGPQLAETRRGELSCARRSDITITVTEHEARTLRDHIPHLQTIVVPTIHEPSDDPGRPHAERRDLLFVGGFQHPPNVDAAVWLVEEIFPLVRREIDARLWIVGSNPTERVWRLASLEVIVTGFIPDLGSYLRDCRVFVSPLRYGAGMKGKNGEAMAAGIPMVTTSIGAEGMGLVDGHDALIRDDPGIFAEAVVRLYRDPELWGALGLHARETVRARWTPTAVRGLLEEILAMSGAGPTSAHDGRRSPTSRPVRGFLDTERDPR